MLRNHGAPNIALHGVRFYGVDGHLEKWLGELGLGQVCVCFSSCIRVAVMTCVYALQYYPAFLEAGINQVQVSIQLDAFLKALAYTFGPVLMYV